MFPILAIGTVIGAVASAIKGANWLNDHVVSAKPDTQTKGFEAALAAESAGQVVPVIPSPPASQAVSGTVGVIPETHGTDYQSLDRMRAGLAAYQDVDLRRNHGPEDVGR
jgi:hypothetical protein